MQARIFTYINQILLKPQLSRAPVLTPVILATQETEIRRVKV
jgi:hypothetical protein